MLPPSEIDEIPVHYGGAYANSYDPAFDDVGYVSSFGVPSDFSACEDTRVYRDWDDWCDTDVPDDSDDLPQRDGRPGRLVLVLRTKRPCRLN